MHRLIKSAAGGLVLLAGTLAMSAPASAGDYVVWSCHDENGAAVGAADWASASGACAAPGSGLRVATTGSQAPGASTATTLTIPDGVAIRAAKAWVTAHTSGGFQAARAGLVVGGTLVKGCDGTTSPCSVGTDAQPYSDDNVGEASTPANLSLQVSCDGPLFCGSGDATLYRARFDASDTTAPAVGALGGTAVASGSRRGSVVLTADTTDVGGGVAKRELLVDGKVVTSRDSGGDCAAPYARLAPCPASLAASFAIDTTALSDGAHSVGVRATDLVGQTAERTATIQVSNAAPNAGTPAANAGDTGAPVAAPAAVPVARIALPKRVDLPHKGAILGRLVAADGSPLAGRTVKLATKGIGQPDKQLLPAGTVVSAADGTFPIGTAGESRVVRAYADRAAQDVVLVRKLSVHAKRLRGTVPYRSAFALTGRLDGAGAASAGKVVEVQAFAGKRWRTVSKVTSSPTGTIRWTYRLRNTARPSNYRFRFVVRRVASQPWGTTRSRPVTVRVRPR